MAEETVKPEQQRTIRNVIPPDGLFPVYVNNVSFGPTAFDLRLTLGQLMDVSAQEVTVLQSTLVTMSWLQAKILSQALHDLVEQFEQQNGTITVPDITRIAIQAPDIPKSKPTEPTQENK